MSKNNGKKKSFSTKALIVGCIFLVLSVVWLNLTAAVNMAPFDAKVGGEHWGVLAGTFWFWRMFEADPGWGGLGQMHWGNEDIWSLLIITFCYVISILFVLGVVFAILGKKVKKNLPALLGMIITGWYLAYICAMIIVPLNRGWIWRSAYFEWMVVAVLTIIAFLSFGLVPVLNLLNAAADAVKNEEPAEEKKEETAGLTEEEVREIVRDELGKQEKEEEPEEEEEEEEGMTEDQVRDIVREELSHYEVVEEDKEEEPEPEPEAEKVEEEPEPEPEPEVVEEKAEEEPVEEEPAEEEPEEEEPEEGDEDADAEEGDVEVEGEAGPDDPFAKLRSKRRRASFETKLKKSDEDLRHKYYDLRDYIKSYGVNLRISIPGATFSAHREKFAFLTINGKHIKACFALNPDDYANTPIPVERNEAKKFEDLPLAFKVKSDLSFRRACKLVDDLMAAKGIAKPEEKK